MQNNEEYKKDYSLLRPFDLEKAKNGELVTDEEGVVTWSYVVGPDAAGNYILLIESGLSLEGEFTFPCKPNPLRMKPLCWVEGKPVYKGDVLWYPEFKTAIEVEGYNPRVNDNSGLIGNVIESRCKYATVGEKTWAPFNCWSWNKPKQKEKRTIFINVYPEFYTAYGSEEEADSRALPKRLTCVETEIEYEV